MRNSADFMESHPVFWLEFRQSWRNRFLPSAMIVGCIMGLYLVAQAFSGLNVPMISIIFFPISLICVSFPSTCKITNQLLNDDLLIRTPLEPFQVLSEKFAAGTLFALALYVPCIPGMVLCWITSGCWEWFSGCLFGFVLCLSLLATGLGFMAGAKTLTKTSILTFLVGVYLFAAMPIGIGVTLCSERFVSDLGFRYGDWVFDHVPILIMVLFTVLVGLIGFMVGISTFYPSKYNDSLQESGSAIAYFLMFVLIVTAILPPFAFGAQFGFFAMMCLLFVDLFFLGAPILAISVARWESG